MEFIFHLRIFNSFFFHCHRILFPPQRRIAPPRVSLERGPVPRGVSVQWGQSVLHGGPVPPPGVRARADPRGETWGEVLSRLSEGHGPLLLRWARQTGQSPFCSRTFLFNKAGDKNVPYDTHGKCSTVASVWFPSFLPIFLCENISFASEDYSNVWSKKLLQCSELNIFN